MKPNGICAYCNRTFQILDDGRMREHKRPDGTTCEGTGLKYQLPIPPPVGKSEVQE